MLNDFLGSSVSNPQAAAATSSNMQQQLLNLHPFLDQFFGQKKVEACLMLHREVDMLMDTLFDQMTGQLNQFLAQQYNITPSMFPVVSNTNQTNGFVRSSQLDSNQFGGDGILSTIPVVQNNQIVHSLLAQPPVISMNSELSQVNLAPEYSTNSSQSPQTITSTVGEMKPQKKHLQSINRKIKEELSEHFTVELDPFPLTQQNSPHLSDDCREYSSQENNERSEILSESNRTEPLIIIKEEDLGQDEEEEDEEDCDCYECVSFVLKREEDSDDSVQLLEDGDDNSVQTFGEDRDSQGSNNMGVKRQRLIETEANTSATTLIASNETNLLHFPGVGVFSRTHSSKPHHYHHKKRTTTFNVLELNHGSSQTLLDSTHQQQADIVHQGILITLSVRCFVENCNLSFSSITDLDRHLVDVHGIFPHRCLLRGCNQSFFNKDQLSQHIRLAHDTVSLWQCGKCDCSSKNYNGLYQHTRWTHHEGSFKCAHPNCNFSSENRGQVYLHYKQHYRDLSRQSGLGGGSSSSRSSNAPRQHVCPFEGCGKVFTENGNLRTHERIHLGIKPYRCRWPGCSYASEHSSDTVKHIRIKHFNIPRTLKEQKEKNIVDTRNPRDFMEIVEINNH